jgi:hypothetical protein
VGGRRRRLPALFEKRKNVGQPQQIGDQKHQKYNQDGPDDDANRAAARLQLVDALGRLDYLDIGKTINCNTAAKSSGRGFVV